jgi:sugar phosphate isomerase/epimerase
MKYDRKRFLQLSAGLVSGVALANINCKLSPKKEDKKETDANAPDSGKTLDAFGIQLYTLRDDMPKDPKGVLKQLASFGYKQVEGFEGSMGIYWGMTNTEFKKYMDDLGMVFVSSHCDINKDFEKKANEASAIGMKYLICPYLGPQKKLDNFKKFADKFNQLGEVCKKAGIRFAYHNHDYSFQPLEGQMPQDVMMQNTDAALVDYEMDIYWVVTGGQDPLVWLKKYPNRFRLCHIKDRLKDAPLSEKEASCDVGTGSIDFSKILHEGAAQGMQYYIVEQERYDNSTPIQSAERDAAYLKTLKI